MVRGRLSCPQNDRRDGGGRLGMNEQKQMTRHGEFRLNYKALNKLTAQVDIEYWRTVTGNLVVVATDTDEGPSVTNNVEAIATELRLMGFHFTHFYEHYNHTPEKYDAVIFDWNGTEASRPRWQYGTKEQLD